MTNEQLEKCVIPTQLISSIVLVLFIQTFCQEEVGCMTVFFGLKYFDFLNGFYVKLFQKKSR